MSLRSNHRLISSWVVRLFEKAGVLTLCFLSLIAAIYMQYTYAEQCSVCSGLIPTPFKISCITYRILSRRMDHSVGRYSLTTFYWYYI